MWWYRRTLYLRLTGLFVAVVLVGLAAWGFNTSHVSASSNDDMVHVVVPNNSDSSASSSTTTTEDQSSHDSAEELQRSIPALEHFVESTRGLKYKTQVAVNILSNDDFDAKLLGGYTSSGSDNLQFRLRALRVLKPDQSLDQVLKDFDTQNVTGFYDPGTKALYVRGESVTPALKITLAHELTHALQDQYFTLSDMSGFGSDESLAYTALVEGDATYVELKYYESLSADEQAAVDSEQFGGGGGQSSILNATPSLIELLSEFPYEAGSAFADALVTDGGTAELDSAYSDPPISTSEILDPSAYINGDLPESVPTPNVNGTTKETGTLGMAFLESLVGDASSGLSSLGSLGDASGWVGDAFATYSQGSAACISATIRFDDSTDRALFSEELSQWAAKQGNSIETNSGDREVNLNACAPLSVA